MAYTHATSIVLASASPRRRSLLQEHGYDFVCRPAGIHEIAPDYLSPAEIVLRNAYAKAIHVARQHPDELVLGVDTVVVFQGKIFGKPADEQEALSMLQQLNGRQHEVYSGVWICRLEDQQSRGFVESTEVAFHRRSVAELLAYLRRIGPLDKAGAYAAQDDQGEMIRSIDGSFANVIGLPMERLEEELESFELAYR